MITGLIKQTILQMKMNKIKKFVQEVPYEVQKKIMDRLHYLCTHPEVLEKIANEIRPNIKRHFPKLDPSVVCVNPIPRQTSWKINYEIL